MTYTLCASLHHSAISKRFNDVTFFVLRRIVHSPNLASFFGMTRIENSVTFLFLGDLTTARRYIGHGFHEMQVTVCNVLKGTLKGLQHLHREGLVHQELTLSTVTVG